MPYSEPREILVIVSVWGCVGNMILAPAAVIFAILALIFFLSDGSPHVLSPEKAQIQVVYIVLLVTAVIFGVSSRNQRKSLGRLIRHVIVWLVIISGFIGAFSYREDVSAAYLRLREELTPALPVSYNDGTVEIGRGFDGHYRAMADIGGVNVGFLVDTGSSLVVLTIEDAAAVGQLPAPEDFTTSVSTANGKAYVAPIRLPSVRIGDVEVRNVQAAVAEAGKLNNSLLGMSFLSRLSETTFRGDKLYLKIDPEEGQSASSHHSGDASGEGSGLK